MDECLKPYYRTQGDVIRSEGQANSRGRQDVSRRDGARVGHEARNRGSYGTDPGEIVAPARSWSADSPPIDPKTGEPDFKAWEAAFKAEVRGMMREVRDLEAATLAEMRERDPEAWGRMERDRLESLARGEPEPFTVDPWAWEKEVGIDDGTEG